MSIKLLLKLITSQTKLDKIYLYEKDPYKANYQSGNNKS